MPVLSGKNGTLYLLGNEITPTSNWSVSISGNLKAYGANNTGGWKRRVAGTFDWTGAFEVKVDDTSGTAACPVIRGGIYDALFYVNAPTSPNPSYYAGQIMIATIDVDDDIDDGEILAFAVTWEGHGAMEEYGILEYGPGGSSSGA